MVSRKQGSRPGLRSGGAAVQSLCMGRPGPVPRERLMTSTRVSSIAVLLLVLGAAPCGYAQQLPDPQALAKAGRARRVLWTTSHTTGSLAEPPAYRTERAFPALRFDQPVTIVRVPGSQRMLVAELGGRLSTFPDHPDAAATDLFLDLGQVP